MNKSQNLPQFLFLIVSIISLSIPGSGHGASPKEQLALADSLFEARMYTQSFDLYESIFKSEKKVSPAMLLRMAFIKEGLEDYSDALYFLNLYYKKTYNKQALKKMENLARAHHLTGYEYNDAAFFLNLYHHYYNQIILGLSIITLLVFSMILYHKKQSKKPPVFAGVVFILFLIILLYANNFGREHPKAIIDRNHAYLMDGPSAGAGVIDIVDRGHRVDVLKSNKIWSEIHWQDQVAYIRKDNLKPVDF